MSLIPDYEKFIPSSQFREFRPMHVRKLFSQSSENCEESSKEVETFQVYLRVKPHPNSEYKSSIKVDGSKLVCKPPITSKVYKTADKSEFTFSKIFGPQTTQQDIFEEIVAPSVEDLLNARNGLVFSYGTTNAGKTYTVQGDKVNPGIIPRALTSIFAKINVNSSVKYAPNKANDIVRLSLADRNLEEQQKNDILRMCPKLEKGLNFQADEYSTLQENVSSSSFSRDRVLPVCSVWVSFIELYNEIIYDLLEPPSETTRKALKLAFDKQNYFVKGLKKVCVQSAEEAYAIYLFGRKNLNIASTKLNEHSSRSHCIFMIQLINQSDPEFVNISSLSICDLAGTERQAKTQNVGVRLKETGNINLSLFSLNRCLRALRENQTGNASQLIPYRSSKLTQLFYSALRDNCNERIVMIVNINPTPELYDETQQVLKMCAVACEIKSKPTKNARILQRRTRFSTLVFQHEENQFQYQPFELESSIYEEESTNPLVEDYLNEIEELKKALKKKEEHIEEIKATYNTILDDNTKCHSEQTQLMLKEARESSERRLKSLKEYYDWKISEIANGNMEEIIKLSDSENTKLKDRINSLELELNTLKNSQTEGAIPVSRESTGSKLTDLQMEMMEKNSKIQDLESLLEEAKTEFRSINNELYSANQKNQQLENELQSKVELISCLEQIQDEKEKFIEELEGQIDTLEQVLSKNTIEHEQMYATLEKKLQEAESKNQELTNQYSFALMKMEEEERKVVESEKKRDEIELRCFKLEEELELLRSNELEREQNNVVSEKKLQEALAKCIKLEEDVALLSNTTVEHEQSYKESEKMRQELESKCKELEDTLSAQSQIFHNHSADSKQKYEESEKERKKAEVKCKDLEETLTAQMLKHEKEMAKMASELEHIKNSQKIGPEPRKRNKKIENVGDMTKLMNDLEYLSIEDKKVGSKSYGLRSTVRSPLSPLPPDHFNKQITPAYRTRRSNSVSIMRYEDVEDSSDKDIFRSQKKPSAVYKENIQRCKRKERKKQLFNPADSENIRDIDEQILADEELNAANFRPKLATPAMIAKSLRSKKQGTSFFK